VVVGAQRAGGFVDGEADHCILCAVQRIEVYDTVDQHHLVFWLIALRHLLLSIIYLPLQMMQKCSFTNLCGKWYWSCGLAYWRGSFTSGVDRISHRVPEDSLYRSVLMIPCLTRKCLPDTVRPLYTVDARYIQPCVLFDLSIERHQLRTCQGQQIHTRNGNGLLEGVVVLVSQHTFWWDKVEEEEEGWYQWDLWILNIGKKTTWQTF